MATAIKDLFQLLLIQTKQPNDETGGNDGTTYYFSALDSIGKLITGEMWSPKENTLLDQLTIICDNLFRIGQGRYISQEEILKNILKLKEDLKR